MARPTMYIDDQHIDIFDEHIDLTETRLYVFDMRAKAMLYSYDPRVGTASIDNNNGRTWCRVSVYADYPTSIWVRSYEGNLIINNTNQNINLHGCIIHRFDVKCNELSMEGTRIYELYARARDIRLHSSKIFTGQVFAKKISVNNLSRCYITLGGFALLSNHKFGPRFNSSVYVPRGNAISFNYVFFRGEMLVFPYRKYIIHKILGITQIHTVRTLRASDPFYLEQLYPEYHRMIIYDWSKIRGD